MFSNLKVGTKLIAGFIAVAPIVVGIGILLQGERQQGDHIAGRSQSHPREQN
ncbi:MAG: hypothetical protein WA261_18740 [Candidatus Sulfotelmatobacter sp.]